MSYAIAVIFTLTLRYVYVDNAPLRSWNKNQDCSEVPLFVLETVLGGAFNPRYMSVDKPIEGEPTTGNKRSYSFLTEDFYVDENFVDQIDEEPAWNLLNHVNVAKKMYGLHRNKRGVDYTQEWHCKSKIQWTDLGPDYFPRYLRTVVCLSEKCWFGIYKCKPRSFTVKVLRRKKGHCASFDEKTKIGSIGLPRELRELWVWEERAVNFCCDCSAR